MHSNSDSQVVVRASEQTRGLFSISLLVTRSHFCAQITHLVVPVRRILHETGDESSKFMTKTRGNDLIGQPAAMRPISAQLLGASLAECVPTLHLGHALR